MIATIDYPMQRVIWFGLIIGIAIICCPAGHSGIGLLQIGISPGNASGEAMEETPEPWDQWRGSGDHLGNWEGAIPSEGQLRWDIRTSDQVQSSPVFYNGSVIMGSDDGKLYAVEADSGVLQWKFTTGGAVQATPLIIGDRLYVGSSDGSLYCLEIPGPDEAVTEPMEVWSYPCGSPIVSSAHTFNHTLVFGCQDGSLFTLSLQGDLLWKVWIGWEIWASPLMDTEHHRAFIGATNGNFSCIDLSEETVAWTIDIGEVYSSGCLWNDTIYIGSGQDHEFMAIDPDDGSIIWTFDTDLPVFSTPSYHQGRLFFTSYERVWCIPSEDPDGDGIINETEMRWSTNIYDQEGGSSPLVADEFVYVGSDDGNLYCLDASSGVILWNFTTQGYVYSSPSLYNGSIYFGSCDDSIYCIGNRLIGLHVTIDLEMAEMKSDQTQLLIISVTDQNGTVIEGAAVTVSLSAGEVGSVNGDLGQGNGNKEGEGEDRFITGTDGTVTVRFIPPQVSSRSTIEARATAERSGMRPGKTIFRITVKPGKAEDQDSPAESVSDQSEKRVPYYFMLSLFIIIDVVLAVIMRSKYSGSENEKKEDADHSNH